MTLDEQRRMAMLEATLREVRRISRDAARTTNCVPPDEAYEGTILDRWNKVSRQIDMLVP